MHKAVTTLLDLLGLLLVAAGGYYLAEPTMGRSALLVAGAVVLCGSQLAARAADPRPDRPSAWLLRLKARMAAWWARRAREEAT